MSGFTNRGKLRVIEIALANTSQAGSIPVTFNVHLCTPATAPTAGTDTLTALTQIADGAGYATGGYSIARNLTDWDVQTEDDANTMAYLQLKDVVWTATATFPASGSGARWAVLCDDEAVIANREVYFYWDLTSERTISNGQTLTLQNSEVRLTES
jgi:hypothetical protein